jgi:hypothetical protein
MIEHIDRRVVLAIGAASLLGSCSRMGYSVVLTAQPTAVDGVREAVRSFAVQHNYQPEDVVDRGSNDLFYRGRWSIFWFYAQSQMPPESFVAEFRHRDEILFPRDDLETWLKDFVATIRKIDGVFVPEGYE